MNTPGGAPCKGYKCVWHSLVHTSSWSEPTVARGCPVSNARMPQSVHAQSRPSDRSHGQKPDAVRKTRRPSRQAESDRIRTVREHLQCCLCSSSWGRVSGSLGVLSSLCSLPSSFFVIV